MRRQTRPHPLHSFKFWFLIIAAGGATIAWKLDLLPMREAARKSPHQAETELETADPAAAELGDPGLADVFGSQSEPGIAASADQLRTPADAPRSVPSIAATAENPFGNARPEFVPVQGSGVDSNAGVRGTVVWANGEERGGGGAEPAAITQAEAITQSEPVTGTEPVSQSRATYTTQSERPADGDVVDFSAVEALLARGTIDDDIAAHRALSEMYWQTPDVRSQLYDLIEQQARRIYFQPQPHYMEAYTVQPGDNLEAIAKQYSVTPEYLARMNRTDPNVIRAGQKLKVIKGPFNAVVDLSDFEITIHCHGYFVYRFPVGVGKDESSPIGTFSVLDKVQNPPYYGPEGAIAADDPANPIGERWISIGDSYGIHGTIDPESIGKNESRGCVRMHNEDVEIVYDLLTIGSEVVIQR